MLQLDLNNEFEGQIQPPLNNQNRWEIQIEFFSNSCNENSGNESVSSNFPNARCMGGKFWCIKDVCGLFCVFFTWLLILYAEYVTKSNESIL